jgi:hypothetical protein
MELHLKKGDKLLGVLRSYSIDFPWLLCKFEPTDAFVEIEPLFQEELKILNTDNFNDEAWESVYSQIEAFGVRLVNINKVEDISDFMLHIQGDEAWCRY